jgi:hypothetical protein
MTIGKHPSIGIGCKTSMKGVRISGATLFMTANMPKEIPQAAENKSAINNSRNCSKSVKSNIFNF